MPSAVARRLLQTKPLTKQAQSYSYEKHGVVALDITDTDLQEELQLRSDIYSSLLVN